MSCLNYAYYSTFLYSCQAKIPLSRRVAFGEKKVGKRSLSRSVSPRSILHHLLMALSFFVNWLFL